MKIPSWRLLICRLCRHHWDALRGCGKECRYCLKLVPTPWYRGLACKTCDDTGFLTDECVPCGGGGFTGYGRGYGDVCDDCGGQRRQVVGRCPACKRTRFTMEVRSGVSRLVVLTRSRAFKFPRPCPWKSFLWGLLANMQEAEFSRARWPELCPVLWSLPGGFLVVMPRAEVCTEDNQPTPEEYARLTNRPDHCVPAEHKASSWGRLNGRLVAVDYG